MRLTLLLILSLTNIASFSQNQAVISMLEKQQILHRSGEVYYETVDSSLKGISKDVIYKAAKRALAEIAPDSKESIRLTEADDGTIVSKGYVYWEYKFAVMNNKARVWFTLVVTARDGKFRITAKDYQAWESYNAVGGPTIGDISTLDKMVKASDSFESRFWPAFDISMRDYIIKLKTAIHSYASAKDDF